MQPPAAALNHNPLSRDCGRLSLVALVLLTSSLVARIRGGDDEPATAPGGEAAFSVSRPTSIDDLVRRAEVIVVARVEAVIDSGERPIVEATPPPGAPPHPKLAYTDYALHIERVVGGAAEAGAGGRLVLRIAARPGDKAMFDGLRVPRVGNRRLFVLEHPPAAEYHVLASSGSIYRIDRTPVTLDDVDDTSVAGFTTAVSPAAFEDALRAAMQERLGQ